MPLHHCRLLLAAAFGTMAQLYSAPSFTMESEDAEVIASQLRRQGVACTRPRSAARDTDNSTPHETVWKLHCDEASYRVALVPHFGARITPICREDQRDTSDGAERLGKKD
jgi:hypothetical protein